VFSVAVDLLFRSSYALGAIGYESC